MSIRKDEDRRLAVKIKAMSRSVNPNGSTGLSVEPFRTCAVFWVEKARKMCDYLMDVPLGQGIAKK